MESNKISDNVSEIAENVRNYVQLRIDLLMLKLTEKLAKLVSHLLITVIFFIIFVLLTFFISLAFIFWFKDYIGPAWAGCLIIAGFYLVVGFIIYLLRTRLFVNPVVAQLSKILLEEEDEDEI
jgi:TRAP-type C4-dicarboxylate transport system permease small subunit